MFTEKPGYLGKGPASAVEADFVYLVPFFLPIVVEVTACRVPQQASDLVGGIPAQ